MTSDTQAPSNSLTRALANLFDAVEGVLAYSWDDNDDDAVETIDRLRKTTEDLGIVQRLSHEPWEAPGCDCPGIRKPDTSAHAPNCPYRVIREIDRASQPPSPEPHVIKQIEHALQDNPAGISREMADYITGAIADYRHALTKPDEQP